MTRFLLAIALLFIALPAVAQDTADSERSYFIGFVEGQLSTPNRQIRINGIQGVLSSNATINEITIADREGVWLRITNARIVWTRSALLLGRLSINTLAADSIDVLRRPLPAEGLPAAESSSFSIPELPISVTLGALDVPRVTFGEGVFGLASQLAITGRLQLAGGALDTALDVTRIDGPGGKLALTATYANSDQVLNLDLTLDEPQNGIVANLLNLEGRPPVALALKGNGPLADLDLDLTLDANARRILTGTAEVRQQAEGFGFVTNVEGPIAELIPPHFRDFFGAETKLAASGLVKQGGGLLLEKLDLTSAALTVAASAETGADGFLQRLTLDTRIDNGSTEKVVLPVPGGTTTVDNAALTIAFGQTPDEKWTGSLNINGLSTDTFASKEIALTMGGLAQNLNQPADRHITFDVEGAASGITATRADVAKALGDTINLDIEGGWNTGAPVHLAKAALSGNGLSVLLAGDIANFQYQGDIAVKATSIAPFSELAGRDLSGGLDLTANGSFAPIGGAFDLTLDGVASALRIGTPAVDNLLDGETRITGGVARGETGLAARQLRIFNDQVSITADGKFATGAADFNFDVDLSDLALVSDRASGKLTATGRANGSDGLIGITFGADVAEGSLVGKPLKDAVIGFEGTLQKGDVNGQVTGKASLGGVPVQLSTAVELLAKQRKLGAIDFSAGGTRITGDVTQTVPDGLLDGKLKLASDDISTAAALLLTQASGAINADIALMPADSKQNATIAASVKNLVVDTTRIGQADVQAGIADLFGVPMVNGSVNAKSLSAAGIDVARLNATAKQTGNTTDFSADAALDNGATVSAKGALSPVEGGFRVNLAAIDLKQGALAANLVKPASIQIRGQNIAIDDLALNIGGGQVGAHGTIADQLDLAVSIEALPLAIANAIRPDLGLGGTLDGTANVTGTRAKPNIAFDVKGRSIAAAALKQAGLQSIDVDAKGTSGADKLNLNAAITSPNGLNASVSGAVPLAQGPLALDVKLNAFPLAVLNAVVPNQKLGGTLNGTAKVTGTRDRPAVAFDLAGRSISAAALQQAGLQSISVDAKGNSNAERLNLNATVTGPSGLNATVNGAVPLARAGALALDVRLNAFPLAVLNAVAPGQKLGGNLSGSARVTGTLANPAATFDLRGDRLSAGALDSAGLSPLNATAAGNFANRVVTLTSASATGPQGLTLTANGRVPLSGNGLGITINGQAPLSLANRFLADRGAQASGTISIAASVSGSIQKPSIRGMFSTVGARLIDPDTNVQLRDIAVMASIDGETVTIRNASAALAAGGTITASGTVSINAGSGFPANIAISLNEARYADGNLVVATLSGRMAMTGPLARDPTLSGDITVSRAEITVPETFGGSAAALDVKHIDPSKAVLETLKRAHANDGTPMPSGRPSVVRLDLNIRAPNQLFVRGRGLDAEMGGSVRLTGPVTNIQPVGGFKLIRGRLSILSQRITFDEGTVTLVGDLDPFLNFVARSSGSDITVFITVSGRVSDLDIKFSSQPELPQDEVLARLIFNRGINELSAFQIAQLASAAAELAGGPNNSLLGSLRQATGLDDLDVATDARGNAVVRAGRYIQDNIYLGVEAGAGGSTRGTINLDITDNLKARGAVGADGDSGLGVFYERDY